MRKGLIPLFTIFRALTLLVTFIFAVTLEHAGSARFSYMVALFAIFFLWLHIREFLLQDKYPGFLPFTFIADIILLILLDDSSRYVVNYYFNIYYFFVLISAGFTLGQRQRLVVSLGVVCAAFVKYYTLIQVALSNSKPQYNINIPFVFSYIFFTMMVFITLAVFFNYSRVLSEEKSRLDVINRKLKEANDLAEQKNQLTKELTIFEERNRIAREIHDSVGHNLTGLVMNLEFCEKLAEMDPEKIKNQISSCKSIARECLTEIRKSVQALKPQTIEQMPLIKSIQELAAGARQKLGINAEIQVDGEIYKTQPDFNLVIYRTVQEALTNSAKHGKATAVEVRIKYMPDKFSIFIKDNGIGTVKFKTGNGLKGMTERIRELSGDISFYSSNGFMINIIIPIEKIV